MEAEQKIAAYKEQLAQIEAYLTSDETNPEWLKLKHDIEHVIKMTEKLIEVQKDKALDPNSIHPNDGTAASSMYSTYNYEKDNYEALTSVEIGDHIEVMGDRPYPAVITGVSSDMSECTLKYYEYGKEVTLPLEKMRKIVCKNGFTVDQVGPGLKCQCRYASDRKWYDVVVDALTPHGYTVNYTKFGNKEEVPLEYLRPTPIAHLKGEKVDAGEFIVPENLKILPTDTEDEKTKKKKKIKLLKSKNRKDNIDREQSAVQNTWKAFTTKNAIQSKKSGGISHVKKRSMFASPEEVEGKVGVTRSGKGMTHVEDRKRYKLNGPS